MVTQAIIVAVDRVDPNGDRVSISSNSTKKSNNSRQTITSELSTAGINKEKFKTTLTSLNKQNNNNLINTVNTNQYFYCYKIRVPFIDGYNNAEQIPDESLTWAVAILPPHMHKTQYTPGDLVYITFDNLDLSYPLIIGMAPNSQETGLNGSIQSSTKVSVDNISDLLTIPEGNVVLPYNTVIRASNDNSLYVNETFENNESTPYVTGSNLSYLRNVNAPIQGQFQALAKAIINSFDDFSNIDVTITCDKGPQYIEINKNVWLASGQYPGTSGTYIFIYNSSTNTYYSKIFPERRYTKDQMLQQLGITIKYSETNVGTITVTLTPGPVKIERGGTNATTKEQARENLDLKANIIIDQESFENLGTNIQPNTIYFIY